MEPEARLKVLFLCTHNSARSQMAEGLLRRLAGHRFEASSYPFGSLIVPRRIAIIGTVPEEIKPDGETGGHGGPEEAQPADTEDARDLHLMRRALEEAALAAEQGEVPVGAVVARDGEVLAAAHNERETLRDPTAHAELLALRRAARELGSWRLTDCTLYATLEPCPMCAGALHAARISRLVYAAPDPKAGAAGTLYDLPADRRLNHTYPCKGGVLRNESAALLRTFFEQRRKCR
jgi:tRNA(adenine34) deaminase